VGTWGEILGKEKNWGVIPGRLMKNYFLSQRIKSNQSTLAAKWTVKVLYPLILYSCIVQSASPLIHARY